MKVLVLFLLLRILATAIHAAAPTEDDPSTPRRRRRPVGGRGHPHHDDDDVVLRITRLEELMRDEDDGTFLDVERLAAVPVISVTTEDDETTTTRESDDIYTVDLAGDIVRDHVRAIATGTLYVRASGGARVSEDDDTHIILDGDVSVINADDERERRLPPTARGRNLEGREERTLAVVRVSWDTEPNHGHAAERFRQHIFGDGPDDDDDNMSLRRQYRLCSQGNLIFHDAGVYEVTVPGPWTAYPAAAHVRVTALDVLTRRLGVDTARDLADHVMVVIPANGYAGFVANAGMNHHISTYNIDWALDVMVYMHEIGHNLGLNHGKQTKGGGDYSAYMSATGWKPNLNGPAKCFNAHDNNQMGWYDNRKIDMSSTVTTPSGRHQHVNLIAFSETAKAMPDELTLLTVGPYSLQYNFASEFNWGTEISRNQVVVAYRDPENPGVILVESDGLDPEGGVIFSANYSGRTLQIEACERIKGNSNRPNAMKVAVSWGQADVRPCQNIEAVSPIPPPPPPTHNPTRSPTKAPTPSPSEGPSMYPSAHPTSLPTPSPTAKPTGRPTPSPTAFPMSSPTKAPTGSPSEGPSRSPSAHPTSLPTPSPTVKPTGRPTPSPTAFPTSSPTYVTHTLPRDDQVESLDLFANTADVTSVVLRLANAAQSHLQDHTLPFRLRIGRYTLQYNVQDEEAEFQLMNAAPFQGQLTIEHSSHAGETEKVNLLPDGNRFLVSDFEGSGKPLQIVACGRVPGAKDTVPDAIKVGIALGKTDSPCVVLEPDEFTPRTAATTTTEAPPPDKTMPSHPVGAEPPCPDTSQQLIRIFFRRGEHLETVPCHWLLQRKHRPPKRCDELDHMRHGSSSMTTAVSVRVSDVCIQECASITHVCRPSA